MSKKTFKGNPAMQFISQPEDPQPTAQAQAEPIQISGPPKGYKLDPRYVEIKSRRVQLVWQPSLYRRVKAEADKAGLSVNEYVHEVLDRFLPREEN